MKNLYPEIHPGLFLRKNYPHLTRVADLATIVYDNIDQLVDIDHPTVFIQDTLTSNRINKIVRCRVFIGEKKTSIVFTTEANFGFRGPTQSENRDDYAELNRMLRFIKIPGYVDFTGDEISDTEHFFTSAVLACTLGKSIGPALALIGAFSWDVLKPIGSDLWNFRTTFDEKGWSSTRSNWKQFTGVDSIGEQYGRLLITTNVERSSGYNAD